MGCGATKNLQRQIREKSVWISHKFNEDSDNLNKNSHQIVEILSPKDFLHKGKKRIENNRPKTNDQRTNDFFEKLNLNQSFESKTRSRSIINGETRSRSMNSIDFENSEMKKLDEKETEEAKNSISAEKMKELMENFENLAVVLKICETIENLNDPKLAENLKKLEMLSEIPRNENSGLRRKWARRLCEFGFVSFWTKLWPKFWLSECVERDEVELLVPRICFTYALRAMWNTTDLNHRACRQLAKQNGIAMIVEKLKSPIFDFNSKGNRFRTSTSKLISYRFRAPTSTSMSTSTSISTSTSSSNSNSNRLRSSKSNPTLKSVSTSASASTSNRFRAPTSNSVPTSTSASTSTSTSVSKRFRAQTSNSISNRFRTSNSTPNLNRHQSKNAVQRKRYFLNGLLSILHNSMRNCPEAVIQAKKSGAISIISKFLNTSHQITKLKAIICLIYLLPYQRDDEILKNLTKNQNLQQLLNSLKNSLQNEEHSNNGISAETIVDALNNLAAVNDFLKFTIVSMDLGPLLLKLINEAQNDFENYAAVKTVWNLSFHSTVKEQLKQEPVYMEGKFLKPISNSTDFHWISIEFRLDFHWISFGFRLDFV